MREKKARVLAACEVECKRQQVGFIELTRLLRAYDYAENAIYGHASDISEKDIEYLGTLIDSANASFYRRIPVTFANMETGLHHDLIPQAMKTLLVNQQEMTVTEFLKEFLLIHPFADGNGRVAFLLFNLKNGSMDYPLPLPDLFRKDSAHD